MKKPLFVVDNMTFLHFPPHHDFKEVRDAMYWVLPGTKPTGVIVIKAWDETALMDVDIYQCCNMETAQKVVAMYQAEVQAQYENYLKS